MTSEEKKRLFRALFDKNHAALLAYALRRTPDASDAAEVMADTMLAAWRRIDDVPAGEETRPWLYGVARRCWATSGGRTGGGVDSRSGWPSTWAS